MTNALCLNVILTIDFEQKTTEKHHYVVATFRYVALFPRRVLVIRVYPYFFILSPPANISHNFLENIFISVVALIHFFFPLLQFLYKIHCSRNPVILQPIYPTK